MIHEGFFLLFRKRRSTKMKNMAKESPCTFKTLLRRYAKLIEAAKSSLIIFKKTKS